MAVFSEASSQLIEICDGGISLYGDDGNRYAVPVPQQLVQVLYISDGLILKCKAEKKFHHSQVLGSCPISPPLYTYLTLTKHPYSDLYPLADLNKTLYVSTHLDIVFTSQRFPVFIAYDSSLRNHVICLLRVNLSLLEKESNDLESLDPNKRDDFFGKHVGNEPLLLAEQIYVIPNSMSNFSHIEIISPSYKNELVIYLQSQEKIRIFSYKLHPDCSFPYNSIQEIGEIENIIRFEVKKRDHETSSLKINDNDSPSLIHFKQKANEYASFMYVLSKNNEVQVYDGQYLLCSFGPDDINNAQMGIEACIDIPISINNTLVKLCMSVFQMVLPQNLYQTLQSDLIQRLITNRIRTNEDQNIEKGKDRSSE